MVGVSIAYLGTIDVAIVARVETGVALMVVVLDIVPLVVAALFVDVLIVAGRYVDINRNGGYICFVWMKLEHLRLNSDTLLQNAPRKPPSAAITLGRATTKSKTGKITNSGLLMRALEY